MERSKTNLSVSSDALGSRQENKHQKRSKFVDSFFDFIKISNHSASLCASGLLIEDEFTYMWQMLCVFPLWLPITSLGHLEACSMLEVFFYLLLYF